MVELARGQQRHGVQHMDDAGQMEFADPLPADMLDQLRAFGPGAVGHKQYPPAFLGVGPAGHGMQVFGP